MAEENISINRDYVDTFSIKQFGENQVMPKYFPDIETSHLTTGLEGMLNEYISTITEDSFNAGSSMVAEAFPTRACMESSIYSNAAIFQISDSFADAGRCDFFIAIPEEDIKNNFITKEGSKYSYFYIDKDTRVMVEGIPFVLDYDIEIRAMYRQTQKKWIFSAKYLIDSYKNSVSDVTDPYIKLKQTPTGLLILQVTMKQYVRTVEYESIVDNATLNYPTVTVSFSGKLLGFDVLYKSPTDSDYNTQLTPKVIYSLPSKEPFCYYKMLSNNKFEISFTTKDSYFQPAFNSELEIIIYTTKATDGNFEEYTGENISVIKGDTYDYSSSWMIAVKPMSGCSGGKERLSIEGLRQLTVEGFTTANSLNTEHDLQTYFNNYKYRYDNEVLFLKKRNDAVELLFSAFMFIKDNDYIFPTNTLMLDTNVQYLDYKEGGFYNMDPGFLFGYKSIDVYYIPVFYVIVDGDGEKYDKEGHYFDKSGVADTSKDISLETLKKKILTGTVKETDHSYYRLAGDDSSIYYLYMSDGTVSSAGEHLSVDELFTKFTNGELTYGSVESSDKTIDFIMDFEKDASARKDYIAYFEKYKEEVKKPELTFKEYLFDYTFKDYKKDKKIDTRRTLFNTDVESFAEKKDFMFTNPFILTIAKDTGLISYYQSFISQACIVDFVDENDDDAFVQFVTYTFRVERDITSEKRYHIKVVLLPSVSVVDDETPYCKLIYNENDKSQFILADDDTKPSLSNFNKELLKNNDLRLVLTFQDEGIDIGYFEMIPTNYDATTEQITFEGYIYTDDYITSSNKIRHTHICPHCGHQILNSANANVEGLNYYCDNCRELFKEGIINIRESDSLLIPITDLLVKLTTLYKDPENTSGVTNNTFAQFDSSYDGYIWTNQYSTLTNRVTLIQPLDMMRSAITYKDYYVTGNDALDCTISDIPLLKYSILAYKDSGMKVTDPLLSDDIGKFQYFMNAFLSNYDVLKEAKQYLNGMNIDTKFYNTYGKSTNFDIGENGRPIDTNNIAVYFDVWLVPNVDQYDCETQLKLFIKDYIETINDEGTNNLYISNLIREIENNFTFVHHLKFKGINKYDTNYQSIINKKINLDDLTKEQRRSFVPDLLVINTNNIYLSFYQDE